MPLLIPIFFVALIALLGTASLPKIQAQSQISHSQYLVSNLFAYRQGINAHLLRNFQQDGFIDINLVSMPLGYINKNLWANVIVDGVVFVYPSNQDTMQGDFIYQAYQNANRSPLMGVNVDGQLVGITGFATGLPVPLVIPNGTFVIAGN